jgi:hypothetical protein
MHVHFEIIGIVIQTDPERRDHIFGAQPRAAAVRDDGDGA